MTALGPYDSRSVYAPRNLDQLHAGPVGREFAAFTAAVRDAQHHPMSGGGALAPGGSGRNAAGLLLRDVLDGCTCRHAASMLGHWGCPLHDHGYED